MNPQQRLDSVSGKLDADPMNADLLLELLGMEDDEVFRQPRWRKRLLALEERAITRCMFEHAGAFSDPALAWMLVEHVIDDIETPDVAVNLLRAVLRLEPDQDEALRRAVDLCIEAEMLLELGDVAAQCESATAAARLILIEAFVAYIVLGEPVAARAKAAEALDPRLDWEEAWAFCVHSVRAPPEPPVRTGDLREG